MFARIYYRGNYIVEPPAVRFLSEYEYIFKIYLYISMKSNNEISGFFFYIYLNSTRSGSRIVRR